MGPLVGAWEEDFGSLGLPEPSQPPNQDFLLVGWESR